MKTEKILILLLNILCLVTSIFESVLAYFKNINTSDNFKANHKRNTVCNKLNVPTTRTNTLTNISHLDHLVNSTVNYFLTDHVDNDLISQLRNTLSCKSLFAIFASEQCEMPVSLAIYRGLLLVPGCYRLNH